MGKKQEQVFNAYQKANDPEMQLFLQLKLSQDCISALDTPQKEPSWKNSL